MNTGRGDRYLWQLKGCYYRNKAPKTDSLLATHDMRGSSFFKAANLRDETCSEAPRIDSDLVGKSKLKPLQLSLRRRDSVHLPENPCNHADEGRIHTS